MKWNFKIPHNLPIRLFQCLLTGAAGGVLYLWIFYYHTPTSMVASDSITTHQETKITETEVLESKTKENSLAKDAKTSLPLLPSLGNDFTNSQSPEKTMQDDMMGILLLKETPMPQLELPILTFQELKETLSTMTDSYSGEWSIYIKDLETGEVLSLNDQSMESASLIKLFVMGAVMEQINQGNLEETDRIRSLLSDMITVSSNNACNELVQALSEDGSHQDGMTVVNKFAKDHGFAHTLQINGLDDPNLWVSEDTKNHTSTRDCGEILSQIYQGDLVSHLASYKMETLLLGQKKSYKIPSAIPSGVSIANKTGETDNIESDAAIIYSPGGDYILCVMSENWDSKNQAIQNIRDISKVVYRYFNPDNLTIKVTEDSTDGTGIPDDTE